MKKVLLIIFTLLMLNSSKSIVLAHPIPNENSVIDFPTSNKENRQNYNYFILELLNDEIFKAMRNYYKDPSISGYATLTPPLHQDTVSIASAISSAKANENNPLNYSFAVKITISPTNNDGKMYGTDTVYFGIVPQRYLIEIRENGLPPATLLKYEHKNPPENE